VAILGSALPACVELGDKTSNVAESKLSRQENQGKRSTRTRWAIPRPSMNWLPRTSTITGPAAPHLTSTNSLPGRMPMEASLRLNSRPPHSATTFARQPGNNIANGIVGFTPLCITFGATFTAQFGLVD